MVRFLEINGVGQFSNFQSNYRIKEIPRVNLEQHINSENITESNKSDKVSEDFTTISSGNETGVIKQIKSHNPSELSITFNKRDDFSYIGREKNLEILDIEQAISDMKQDSILQEYQYFVGNAENVFQSEDGMVLSKL